MNRFSFAKLGRTLLMLTAVTAFGLLGCSGDDNPSNGGNNNNGGPSAGLVCADGEAWVGGGTGSCGSATDGLIFKSDGDLLDIGRHDNVWKLESVNSWQTDGNRLLVTMNGREDDITYDVSNGALTLTFANGKQLTYNRKCSGVVIVGTYP